MSYEPTNDDIQQMVNSEMDWRAAQHADELAFQKQAVDILKVSLAQPLSEEQAMTVAAMAGIATDFYKVIRST